MTGVRFPTEGNYGIFYLFATATRQSLEAHPVVYAVGTGAHTRGVHRPGREVYHPPQSRAEVKDSWSYTSTPQYAFIGTTLLLPFTFYTSWA